MTGSGTGRRVEVGGGALFVAAHGAGPPLLVMHGGLGLDHAYLRPWLDPLGALVRLVYYDHRGNGRSDPPAAWAAVDHATWADDADRLRAALGHARTLVFGHSYGAFLALEYALRHPERVAGLVLAAAAPAMDYAERVAARLRERTTPAEFAVLAEALSRPPATDAELEATFRRVLPHHFADAAHPAARTLLDGVVFRAAASRRSSFECLPGFDVTARLHEIRAPTLLVTGRHDWMTPVDAGAERLRAGIAGARLVVLEGSGHFAFAEEPEAFLRAVEGWLREHA